MSEKTTWENDKNTWDHIDTLVLKFQSGDKKAGVELMEKFNNYFNKFLNIVKYGNIDYKDRESRFFISLFMSKDDYTKIRRYFQCSDTISKGMQMVSFISNTYGSTPEEDILQDFYMIFFKLLNRYKPIGKTFGAYLCTAFVYELARHIQSYLKDPITRQEKLDEYSDIKKESHNNLDFSGEVRYDDTMIYTDEVEFSDAWVRGITCDDVFTGLTPFERMILIKYYVEDKTDKQIASETGFKRNSINKKRAKAISKVKNKTAELKKVRLSNESYQCNTYE